MKIDRLLEIAILLLNKGTVTARELSERFEVSTRTIYRDIDTLSAAGVPVYTNRGSGGGISLMENYTFSKAMISDRECESILFALKTLEATRYPELNGILDKLGAIFHRAVDDWMEIDFSPWGSDPNEHNRFNDIKGAVLDRRVLAFDYVDARNLKSPRRIEPLKLLFKGQAWYMKGWDLMREDYRTFRVSRMKNLHVTRDRFDRDRRREPRPSERRQEPFPPPVPLELRFTGEALYRLYDDFDDSILADNGDGTYTVRIAFPEDEWVYGYIQSFGPYVEVISPAHIRRIIAQRAEKIRKIYREI